MHNLAYDQMVKNLTQAHRRTPNYVLQNGESISVSMMMMDEQQKVVAEHHGTDRTAELREHQAAHARVQAHADHYGYQANRAQADAAYEEMCENLSNAYKGDK